MAKYHAAFVAPGGRAMNTMFSVGDIPDSETIFSFMRKNTSYGRACGGVHMRLRDAPKIELDLVDVDVERLKQSVLDIVREYGFSGWRHKDGESKTYGGFSLTYNPNHQDGLDPHVSSIGTPKNTRSEFFWNATGRHEALKHSYFDSYGFRMRTPASKTGYLGQFIDSFTRPLVRSRVGIIPGENVDANDKTYQEKEGWHRDEPVFENLRVNIPLQTDENFVFQMEGEEPYHLEVGKAYTWDTNKPHRVFARGSTRTMRIHLVLGFSPWFDYDAENDTWAPNGYFGKLHPFDMVAEGILSRHLRLPRRRLL
jgi:hypothetical protein